ncbi:MAG: DNA translocase FtsK 4TM domain-containing protein, partial [bacterium]
MPTRRSGVVSSSLFSDRFNEVVGLLLIASAVFLALALWSFHIQDPSWTHRGSTGSGVHNYGGTVGAYLAGGLVQLVGAFAALVPLGVFVWGVTTFAGIRPWWPGWHGLGGLTIALSCAGLFHKAFLEDPLFGTGTLAGGVVGYGVAVILETALGRMGSWVVLFGTLMAAMVGTTGMSLAQILVLLFRGPRWIIVKVIPVVWIMASDVASQVWSAVQSWLTDRLRNWISECRAFWRKVSAEGQGFSSFSVKRAGLSNGDYSDEPAFTVSHEDDDREADQGGSGLFFAVGRGLARAKKFKLGVRAHSTEKERGSPRLGSSSALAVEEASLPLFPGEAADADAGDKGLEFGFSQDFGDKGVVARRANVEKSRGPGIRIGRRRVPMMGSVRPAHVAEKNVLKTPDVETREEPDVRVRHAGLDGEAEIVRIEDDAVVSDMAIPDAVKSGLRRRGRYALPSLDLFADAKSESLVVDEKAIRKKSTILEQTLQEFGVEGHVTEVKTGPVITVYEFAPAAGVKVSKISSLSDDLARALSAMNVRIVAPIPGTNVVGIEVPNEKRRSVRIKEILSSREFSRAQDKLTLGIGKDILGRTALTDLAKIPHLLIAGATGAGKSVTLNMMICSLLVRCMPREVRLVLIDPKMLEFSIYDGVPH